MFAPRLKDSQFARSPAARPGPIPNRPFQQESSASRSTLPKWDFGGISVFGNELNAENARGGSDAKKNPLAWNQKADAGSGSGSGSGSGAAPAATPVAVRNGPHHAPVDEPDKVGMEIAITLTSSSGKDEDMKNILDSEQVSDSKGHTGCFKDMPTIVSDTSNTSGFMPGFPIPDDEHGTSRDTMVDRSDNHGGNGKFDFDQLDIWKVKAGDKPQAIPSSGYTIHRTITTGAGKSIVLRTEKAPAAVKVGGFSSDAGPSAAQHDDVVVREKTKDKAKDKPKDEAKDKKPAAK